MLGRSGVGICLVSRGQLEGTGVRRHSPYLISADNRTGGTAAHFHASRLRHPHSEERACPSPHKPSTAACFPLPRPSSYVPSGQCRC